MTQARKLVKRRNSIRNIRKITRTMELISTARFSRAMNRATAAVAYTERITKLVGDLVRAGLEATHPLLQEQPEPRRALMLVLTGNRGMCAGYNSSVLRLGYAQLNELRNNLPEVCLEVSGKRGISAFRFRKIEPDETFTHFEDKPSFEEVDVLADRYIEWFETGRIDRLNVVYVKFDSISKQQAVVETLLPLTELVGDEQPDEAPPGDRQHEFFPSAESILDEVVPMSFKVKLFKCFLDAAVSEQVARMLAMKAATENADGMIRQLTMIYNRARQGQITSELLEIIGGAEALSG